MNGLSAIESRHTTYAGYATRELVVPGTGPTVVMIHGFMHSANAWRGILELLRASGQAAVAVDLPGFGQADPLTDGPLIPQIDAFVADVVRHHGRDRPVVLVGNSLGSAATTTAARNKALPIGAVMPTDSAGLTWRRLTSAAPLVPLVLGALARFPKPVHRNIMRLGTAPLFYGTRSSIDWAVVNDVVDGIATGKGTRNVPAHAARVIAELALNTEYGGIDIPMTVLHGAKDRLVPISASRILAQANPGSRLVIVERAGHCPHLDAPDIVAQHIRELVVLSTDPK